MTADKTRVLHILKHFRPTFTGEGIFTERLTPAMDVLAPDVEHEVLAVATPDPAEWCPVHAAFRRVVYLTKRPTPYPLQQVLLWLWLLRNLRRYQVVHVHTHVDRYFLAYFLAKLFGKRLLLSATLDDSVPGLERTYRPAFRPLVRRFLSTFDAFVAISGKLHGETEAAMPGKSHLIPIGIAIPELDAGRRRAGRARLGIAADELVLVFVGGICERKDPFFLVQRLPEIRTYCPKVKLLLVGPILEPDYHQSIVDYIARHDLSRHVEFVGEVTDPYPLFEAADVMTFASHLEGFGTVVIEAMAHGLPVVVRDLPGVNDFFVRNGETGFRFTEPSGYLHALRRLIEDPALRQRIGTAGRRFAIDHFDMAKIAAAYLRLYGVPMPATPAAPARHPRQDLAAMRPATSAGAANDSLSPGTAHLTWTGAR